MARHITISAVIIFLTLAFSMPSIITASSTGTNGQIIGTNITQWNSTSLPQGASEYIYAFTQGGSSFISSNVKATVDDLATNCCYSEGASAEVYIVHTTNHTYAYNDQESVYRLIGGIAMSGAAHEFWTAQNAGTNRISRSFGIINRSLMVLVSAASNNQGPISVSSPFTIINSNSTGSDAMVIAEAVMNPGNYTVNITYSQKNDDPQLTALGAVLYAFNTSGSYNPSTTTSTTNNATGTTINPLQSQNASYGKATDLTFIPEGLNGNMSWAVSLYPSSESLSYPTQYYGTYSEDKYIVVPLLNGRYNYSAIAYGTTSGGISVCLDAEHRQHCAKWHIQGRLS